MVCKDGKTFCSSVNCAESFETKGQTDIQTLSTEQVPDMVEDYSSYMEGINYSSCKMCVKGFTKAVCLEDHLEKHLRANIFWYIQRM